MTPFRSIAIAASPYLRCSRTTAGNIAVPNHHYELYLELNDIEHRRTKVATPRTNGFVERFNKTILEQFFRTRMREKIYPSIEELHADLDIWLKHYNEERPHRGYRNMGTRPIDTVNQFAQIARQDRYLFRLPELISV